MPPCCINTRRYPSPCGTLLLGSCGEQLCLCDWADTPGHQRITHRLQRILGATLEERDSPTLQQAAAELDEYFAGQRRSFSLPLLFAGSPFQTSAWEQLLLIPCGETITYAEQARRLGRPTAVRAVANANKANAISIFAPCHRVIGKNRNLTGYGGGLETKRYLIELESMPLLRMMRS